MFFSTFKLFKTLKYVSLELKWLAYLSSQRFNTQMTKLDYF